MLATSLCGSDRVLECAVLEALVSYGRGWTRRGPSRLVEVDILIKDNVVDR